MRYALLRNSATQTPVVGFLVKWREVLMNLLYEFNGAQELGHTHQLIFKNQILDYEKSSWNLIIWI